MSRTDKDTPLRVRAQPGFGSDWARPQRKRSQVDWIITDNHWGCPSDPTGALRSRRTKTVISMTPDWRPVRVPIVSATGYFDSSLKHLRRYYSHRDCDCDIRDNGSKILAVDEMSNQITAMAPKGCTHTTWAYESSQTTLTRVELYVGACEIADNTEPERRRQGCWRGIERKAKQQLWIKPPKKWTKTSFYNPERRYVERELHDARRRFNTSGAEGLDDFIDPWTRPSPSGVWGGGYID